MKHTLTIFFSIALATAASPAFCRTTPGYHTQLNYPGLQDLPLSEIESCILAEVVVSHHSKTGDAGSPGKIQMPLELGASDMVTKVYGLVSPSKKKHDIHGEFLAATDIEPKEDEFGLWLENSDGYSIRYDGRERPVTAVARFDGEGLTEFGYFFFFPYPESSAKAVANSDQSGFCGALLQEMADCGYSLGADTLSGELFDVEGDCGSGQLNIRLMDVAGNEISPDAGQYILMLCVRPSEGSLDDFNNVLADIIAEGYTNP